MGVPKGGRETESEAPLRCALSRLIDEQLVDAVFQPIVDLERGEIAALEALSRPRPESGIADATQMFDAASRFGMLWELERVTCGRALEAAASWPASVQLFLNFSPEVLGDPRLVGEVSAGVARTAGLAPGRVVLEITERSEGGVVGRLAPQVERLKALGFQVAIDDVGAGTSGLNRIMGLRPHWLKLDRDLIRDIDRERVKQNLIRFLVHFSRLSGVRIVAEGVEREEEVSALLDLGVGHAQGYYLGRPSGREQALQPGLAAWLKGRCAAAEANRVGQPLGNRVMRLAQPALVMDAGAAVAQGAAALAASVKTPGVALMDRNRFVGWCKRREVLEADAAGKGGAPLSNVMLPGPVWVSPDATVADALDVAATRDERSLAQPLVIYENGCVHGIVPLRELLSAGAELTQSGSTRTAPVTGLPGRVRADEHAERLIARCRQEGIRGPDVAIIDMSRFGDFNAAYGYELGDQLLQDLSHLVQLTMLRGEAEMFLAHLGDDRLLLCGPGAAIEERLPVLARRFDRLADGYCQTLGLSAADSGSPSLTVGLRVVLLSCPFQRVTDSRELHRLVASLRQPGSASTINPLLLGSRCMLIRSEGARIGRQAA